MHHFQVHNRLSQLASANLSLIYYKFTPQIVSPEDRMNFLRALMRINPAKQHIANRINAMKSFCNGEVRMRNTSRFICGTGCTSSLEWGFNFDWTTGMPCLPGSSFKGILLSYLEFLHGKNFENSSEQQKLLDSDTEWSYEEIIKIFGPQDPNKNGPDCGAVIFCDVYPETFSGLEPDVISPHYKNYYGGISGALPDDTEEPVPIFFITLKANSIFNFFFRFRDDVYSPTEQSQIKNKLVALIKEVGQNYGFGAKTSSGYGYFKPV